MSQTQHESMISSLVGIVGADHVLDDEESRSLFSTDLFYDGAAPMCIVSPATPEELAQTVRTLTMGGCAIVPRGGGLSYSAGYVANRADAVLLDMRRLNRIVEINEDDLFVTVETGITWSALNDALEAKGLRTPFWGTGSGKYATVGGALSQHAINFGTGQFGLAAQSVLGLSVVTADGSVLVTGSGGTNENPTPFFRHYGPDLTGLFVGDCGALGIKAKATLQLIRRPPATLHASFEYETIDAFQRAISEVARCHVVSECFGFDPSFPNMRTTYAGIKDGLKLLAGVAKTQGSVLSGVKEAVSVVVAGDSYLKDLGYSIHVTVDGRDEADAHSKMAMARDALKPGGKETEASITKVMRGTPFPDANIAVGHEGERWIPMHGIVPHSRLDALLSSLHEFMDERKDILERHNITWSFVCVLVGLSGVLIEPNLYWRDARPTMLDGYLSESHIKDKPKYPEDLEARAVSKVFARRDDHLCSGRLAVCTCRSGGFIPIWKARALRFRPCLKPSKPTSTPEA